MNKIAEAKKWLDEADLQKNEVAKWKNEVTRCNMITAKQQNEIAEQKNNNLAARHDTVRLQSEVARLMVVERDAKARVASLTNDLAQENGTYCISKFNLIKPSAFMCCDNQYCALMKRAT